MDSSSKQRAAERLPDILAEILDISLSEIRLRDFPGKELDFVVQVQGRTLLVEHRSSGDLSSIAAASRRLKTYLASHPGDKSLPVVLVPYMGPTGRAYCREAGVGCLDLSGNAEMTAPGLRLMVDGRPNRFRRSPTSVSVFAPKSSRVVRWLLMDPAQAFAQRELSVLSGLDEGFVSRIVRRLESDSLVARDDTGRVRVADPALLLEAWREQYRFNKHEIVRGHAPAPSPESLMRLVAGVMDEACPDRYAMTGLCAAWLYTHFASFRSLVVYARGPSPERILEPLGFQHGERGANIWLVVPNDDGVLEGSEYLEGIRCVSTVQTYLDLKGAGERSDEASEEMKRYFVARLRGGE